MDNRQTCIVLQRTGEKTSEWVSGWLHQADAYAKARELSKHHPAEQFQVAELRARAVYVNGEITEGA